MNYLFNVMAFVLLIFPLLNISRYYFQAHPLTNQPARNPFPGQLQLNLSSPRPPDISYIILDEYGREDVLADILQFDNSALMDALRENGFYIADKSYANYSVTQYSLISSLNMDFLPLDLEERELSQVSLQQNRVRRALEDAGYKFITFASGYALTEITDSDYYNKPDGYLNTFEFTYISSTALALITESLYGIQYRNLITNSFDQLEEIYKIEPDKPKFIFTHIQAAHAPFVFGPNGETDQVWIYPITPAAYPAAG